MIKILCMLGIFISLSAFGIKTGLGIASLLHDKIVTLKKKIYFIVFAISVYIVLFVSVDILIRHVPLLNHLNDLIIAMKYGMIIHIIIASGIFLWGIRLLLQKSHNNYGGALFLVLPCPVCTSVIFLTLSFAHNIFSITWFFITALLLCVFFIICLITVLLTFLFKQYIENARTSFLGLMMILTAIYFFLTVLIAPVYKEAEDIYHLASKSRLNNSLDIKSFIVLSITIVIFFTIGFFKKYKKKYINKE